MKILPRALGAAAILLALAATTALAAPSTVATKLQLRGHLPELGEMPALWVFDTASAYDSYRVAMDVADVFPDSGSLFMTFDKELLALYTRGNDSGGRCLRAGSISGVSGSTVALDLSWDASTCGAPASAHYPFVLVSLSRTADDGSVWATGRQVCASAPGVTGSTACAPASGAVASPSPSRTATPIPSPSPTPTAPPVATTAPPSSAAPSPSATRTASASPVARTATPSPTSTAVVAGAEGGAGLLDTLVVLAVGVMVGAFLMALVSRRPRVTRV